MAKKYKAPEAEIELFTLDCDICTVSPNPHGIGDGGETTEMPDEF